jgi:deoxyribodipyrimidine photolyase-related protein
MACLRDAMQNVVDHGYAHHIQRLMVLGLFALNLGVDPLSFHEWHMAMYLDAIDWVSAPNTIGMSQYADGGVVGTKPYCASGNYISKMGNHCKGCRYDPKKAVGDDACPFTTLYWDFLGRHHDRLKNNRRMGFQVRNWERKSEQDRTEIIEAAAALRKRLRGA